MLSLERHLETLIQGVALALMIKLQDKEKA